MDIIRTGLFFAFAFVLLLGCKKESDQPEPTSQNPPSEPTIPSDTLKYLALGDSYTIGESVAPEERWPVLLTKSLRQATFKVEDPEIIAVTGWRTDNLINAVAQADLKAEYDFVSLLIGVNNEFQGRPLSEYETQFEELLSTAIDLAQGDTSKVFVVSIPDYGFTPFGAPNQAAISARIDAFNAAQLAICQRFGVRFYDITPISRTGLDQPSYVAGDGLHPSGEQYAAWVQHCFEGVKEMLLVE